jgi:hypothetical protein
MWQVVHKPTQVVVASVSTRAEAYNIRRSLRYISDEKYRVERI